MSERTIAARTARLFSAFVLCLGLSLPGTSDAHDLGIAQIIIEAEHSGTLKFKAHLSGSTIAGPGLPAGCNGSAPVFRRPTPSLQSISMRFACDNAALADDAAIILPWGVKGALVVVRDGSREFSHYFEASNGAIFVPLKEIGAASEPVTTLAARFLRIGVEHILLGIDHLLFVLMLLLLVSGVRSLVTTITAFTIAHSLTLAVATLGYVAAPTAVIEALIALSIVFMAAEAIRLHQGKAGLAAERPWIVAFGFGLLHGFGFAGALSEIGIPAGQIPVALLFFNIGVEIGQLLFVTALIAIAGTAAIVIRMTWSLEASRVGLQSGGLSAILAFGVGIVATFWFVDRLQSVGLPI